MVHVSRERWEGCAAGEGWAPACRVTNMGPVLNMTVGYLVTSGRFQAGSAASICGVDHASGAAAWRAHRCRRHQARASGRACAAYGACGVPRGADADLVAAMCTEALVRVLQP